MGKTKRKLHSVYLDPDRHELFMRLSKETRIAQAVLLREAVDDLLKKHQLLKNEKQTEWDRSGVRRCWKHRRTPHHSPPSKRTTMANTEFTTASSADVIPAQIACLLNAPQAHEAIAPSFADAPPSRPAGSMPAGFKPRQMKISYLPLTRGAVPFLRLRGKWLRLDLRLAVISA